MGKPINIDLRFNADTSNAIASVQQLQSTLMNISSQSNLKINPQGMTQAISAAKELQIHLNNAFNANTGKLDLSKLNQSLNTSKTNIQHLSSQLLSAGETGKTAFVQLAQSIAAADRPMLALNGKLAAFATTLKNTVSWQISSSAIHGVMGAVQSAYGYAKDLNKSLNDIRIVTGLSAEHMDQFAIKANKAAKALSTTTNEYAKASLIYFQQGLDEQQVEKRSNITTQMANVSGQSAEVVSDQLTAVWNNFAKGGENLEHFADVMVRLGADTASSSDEIATGLEKFAAIGDMVGLSFDSAAAALATVTATTRDSADTVGTAFKTIFARIQGLKLGETLEDGTDLNKYSQALETVGVKIYNANGGLKDMDTILAEMGAKWKTLTEDQKVALAETVAGVRQYNQLSALMENWDFYEENLDRAKNASGSLQEQAELYAESWEAASDKVKASLESIYTDIIDDDFFIGLSKGFAGLLNGVHEFIQGAGGIKTLFIGLGSIFLSSFAHKIQPALAELRHTFSVVFQGAQKQAQALSQQMNQVFQQKLNDPSLTFNESQKQGLNNAIQLNEAKSRLNVNKNLTQLEQQRYNTELQIIQAHQTEAAEIADKVDKAREQIALLEQEFDIEKTLAIAGKERAAEEKELMRIKSQAQTAYQMDSNTQNAQALERAKELLYQHRDATEQASLAVEKYGQAVYDAYMAELRNNDGKIKSKEITLDTSQIYAEYINKINDLSAALNSSNGSFENQITALRQMETELMMAAGEVPGFKEALKEALQSTNAEELKGKLQGLISVLQQAKIPANQLREILLKFGQGDNIKRVEQNYKTLSTEMQNLVDKQKTINSLINQFKPTHVVTGIEKITQTAAGLGQVAMVAQSVRSIFNAWSNDDMSFGEKLTTTFMGLSMIVPGVIGLMKSLNAVTGITTLMEKAQNAELINGLAARIASGEAITAETLAQSAGMATDQAELAIATATIIATAGKEKAISQEAAALAASTIAKKLNLTAEQQEVLSKALARGATVQQALAELNLTSAKGGSIAATITQTLVNWGLNASLAALIATTLVFAAAIGALALVIWGISASWKEFQANTPEGQLKSANQAAIDLTDSLEDAKQAADDLKSKFDEYDQVAKKLQDCKKGSEEWNEALRDNNDKVRELLRQYPELSNMTKEKVDPDTGEVIKDENGNSIIEKAIGIDENGVLSIADWAQEIVINKANLYVQRAEFAELYGKQRVTEKNIQTKRNDIKNDTAALATRLYNEGLVTDKTAAWVTATVNDLINQYGTDAAKHVSKIEGISTEHQQALAKIINSELALKDSINENTTAIELDTQSRIDDFMNDYEGYRESSDADKGLLRQIIGDRIINPKSTDEFVVETDAFRNFVFDPDATENEDGTWTAKTTSSNNLTWSGEEVLFEQYKEALEDRGIFGVPDFSERSELAVEEFASKILGIDPMDITNMTREGDKVKFNVLGEEKERDYTPSEMATSLVSYAKEEQTRDYGEVMTNQINSFGDNQNMKELFAAGVTGNADILSPELIKESDEAIEDYIKNMNILEDTAKEIGDIEVFKNQIKELVKAKKAYNDFVDSFENNMEKILTNTGNVGEAVQDMKDNIQKSLQIKTNLDNIITQEWISENQELLEEFYNGVEGAAERVKLAIGEEIWIRAGLDTTDFYNDYNTLNSVIQNTMGMGLLDLEIGATINDAQALGAIDNIINKLIATGMTADQASKAMVDAFGIDVELDTENSTAEESSTYVDAKPLANDLNTFGFNPATGSPMAFKFPGVKYQVSKSQPVKSEKTTSGTAVKVKSAKYVGGGNITKRVNNSRTPVTTTPSTPPGTINPGGGSGKDKSTKPKEKKEAKKVEPTEAKKKDEEIERYKETTEVLDDLSRELDEIGAAKDEAWGNDKIAQMDKELAKLKQIIKEQKNYINQIGQIDKNGNAIGGKLKIDQDAVRALGATFDEFGRITNYEQIMGQLVDNWNSTQSSLDTREQTYENKVAEVANTEYTEEQEAEKTAAEKANETEKEAIDDARKKADKDYETGKEAIDQYIETLNLSEEATAQLDEYFRQMRQFNYDKLVYQIELRVELNQNDIDDIEFKLERLGENETAKIAERLILIEENAANYIEQAKAEVWGMQEAERLYNLYLSGDEENGISKESYMKQIQEGKKAIQDLEISFRNMIKQIGEELINAFDLANEELDKSYAKFDNLITTMEHYKTVIALTGKRGEESYAEFNKILKASQQVIQNRIASEKAEITMWNEVIAKQKEEIAQLEEGSDERIAAELALENSEEKLQETKEQLMSDIEQLGEYAREIFENSVEQAAIAFEESLFGAGQRLSDKIEMIDMLNARQEEVLTTTNKLYETNKMIYNIEKDIDATTNQRAKQQLINFQNIVKQKQEQTKLNKFELELLQAQYEIEKAKIALEEAQNSKSTVRLSRDSEGNYGYVYTASQDKVADAEQKLADATNAYYNTAMDGAQKYQEQIYGHMEEWEEKVKEVYLDQTLTEEEKNRKIKEINKTYNELIKQDKDLYYIAIGAMQETAYNKQLDYDLLGIESTKNWEVESKKFIEELDLAQQQYSIDTGIVRQETTDNFGDMETAINNTKIAGNTLQQDMETKLIPTLKTDLLEAVGNATLAWKGYREELEKIIELSDNAMLKASQDTKIAGSYDYAGSIMEEFAKGADADLAYIDRLAAERQKKLGNIDLTDYQALMNQYANDPNSAEYRTYAFLRSWKLDMMKKTDYTKMLEDYILNEGGSLEDDRAKDILAMRQQKINIEGLTDVQSNESLVESIKEKKQEQEKQKETQTEVEATVTLSSIPTESVDPPKPEPEKTPEPEPEKKKQSTTNNTSKPTTNNTPKPTTNNTPIPPYKPKSALRLEDVKFTAKVYKFDGKFDTGGYTGDWGPEGKLAMLHEKELVLNKQDTANFLTATEILRDINQMLNRNAIAAQLGMIDLKAMTVNTPADQILQQEVTIHADFPNVTDHNEIELAMSNLINAASQYANREF